MLNEMYITLKFMANFLSQYLELNKCVLVSGLSDFEDMFTNEKKVIACVLRRIWYLCIWQIILKERREINKELYNSG